MTPDQLAKSTTEHGEQRALMQWAKFAEHYGFAAAWDDECYGNSGYTRTKYSTDGGGQFPFVDELLWLHAIPNGGLRDKITASKLKAEGAKAGVLDLFLPLPMVIGSSGGMVHAGLYLEMKRGANKATKQRKGDTSELQDEFIIYARSVGYAVGVYFDWRSAAQDLQKYVEAVRRNSDS